MDRILATLVSRAARRGFAGEPLWLAVAAAAWLVRRSRNRKAPLVWKGTVSPGQRLVITTTDSTAPGAPVPGGT